MKWVLLSDLEDSEAITRGTLFRFAVGPPQYTAIGVVDFMVFIPPGEFMGLVEDSGYHAGNVMVFLPEEARKPGWHAVDAKWLKRNWTKWVYPISTKKVFVSLTHRPKPRLPGQRISD